MAMANMNVIGVVVSLYKRGRAAAAAAAAKTAAAQPKT